MTNVCGPKSDFECALQIAPPFQCSTIQANKCIDDDNFVCGITDLQGKVIQCSGTSQEGGLQGVSPCCFATGSSPWMYGTAPDGSKTKALCSPFPKSLCPIIICPEPTEPSFCCFGEAVDGLGLGSNSNLSINLGKSLSINQTCGYPLSVFNDEEAVQKYFDTFVRTVENINEGVKICSSIADTNENALCRNAQTYGEKILPHFCPQKSTKTCPSDIITSTTMVECSNYVTSDLCKDWVINSRKTGSFSTVISATMTDYCENPTNDTSIPGRDGQWIDDCRCINNANDPVFVGLNIALPFPEQCWYIPCEPGQADDILQPPDNFNDKTNPAVPNVCPSNVCEIITANFNKSKLNENNVNQSVQCKQTKNGAGAGGIDVRSFFERNKGWIIGFAIGGLILILIII